MLKSTKMWQIQQVEKETVREIANAIHCSELIALLLYNRGYQTPEAAAGFLHSEETPYHDPFLMKGMEKVVERLSLALENEEKILVFGDYDADGVTSTSLLVLALRELGGHVSYYIPDRFQEGYGPNLPALERAHAEGVTLVVTVDTGISAVEVAKQVKAMGLDYIVTDHHEPPPVLPDAFAILNPKQPGCPYPFKSLSGVGVAFKLVQALLDEVPTHLLDLAAVGTVSDLVPLEDENRRLVKEGLQALRQHPLPGLRALLQVVGHGEQDKVDSDVIGFQLGPRLNAAGRLQHAKISAELLMTENHEQALQLAETVNQLNEERKKLVEQTAQEATLMVEAMPSDERDFLLVIKEDWHEGILGIVASRLVEQYYRPALVLGFNPETGLAKGSARSIEGFDLFQALSTSRDLLPHFGGHEMAAGLSLKIEDIPELRDRMNRYARQLFTEDMLVPKVKIDSRLNLQDITVSLIEEMRALEPYGEGNQKPKFILEKIAIQSMKQIGATKDHLKLTLTDANETLEAISFRNGDLFHQITSDASLSVVGELGINEWNGFRKPQLFIEDLSIEEWQLFDLRGQASWRKTCESNQERSVYVYFREDTQARLNLDKNTSMYYKEILTEPHQQLRSIVWVDLPESLEQLETFYSNVLNPERIYMVFDHQEENYFENVPSREQFKQVFSLFHQHKNITIQKLRQWATYKGWTVSHIDFIIKVFLELEFVKMEKDVLMPLPTSTKKPLTHSQTYMIRENQAEVEELLLYSSRSSVKNWLNQRKADRLVSKEDILS